MPIHDALFLIFSGFTFEASFIFVPVLVEQSVRILDQAAYCSSFLVSSSCAVSRIWASLSFGLGHRLVGFQVSASVKEATAF